MLFNVSSSKVKEIQTDSIDVATDKLLYKLEEKRLNKFFRINN